VIEKKQLMPERVEMQGRAVEREQDINPVEAIENAVDMLREFDQGVSVAEHKDKEEGNSARVMESFSKRARTQFRNLVMGIMMSGLINIGPNVANAAVFSDGALASERQKEHLGISDCLNKMYDTTSRYSSDIRAAAEGVELFLEMRHYANSRKNGVMSAEEVEFRERIAQNVENIGYSVDLENVSVIFPSVLSRVKQFSKDEKKYSKEKVEKADLKTRIRVDMFRKYLGLEPFGDFLKKAEFKPGRSKDADATYYSFDKEALLKDIRSNWNSKGNIRNFDDFVAYAGTGTKEHFPHMKKFGGDYLFQLGTFNMEVGYDEERKERYISYYDKWDMTPPDLKQYSIDLNSLNYPFEIYGRIYESDLKNIK
jgi:hypothetical protein